MGQDPNATIEVHATEADLVTHRDIVFDGTASTDPNPGGKLKSYAWAATRGVSAACDPSVTSGSNPTFTTNFQCEGQYHVELKVTDTLDLVGHYRMTVEIAPSMNPPAIAAIGPDALAVHRCEGSPLLCRTFAAADGATAFQLSVAAHDVEDGSNLSYAWTYEPPAGVDPTKVHVTFQPSANTPTPLVQIASDGAVAGDWRFLAHATDSVGLSAVKAQTIKVQNTVPTVQVEGADVLLSHSFLAGIGSYVASATIHATLSDADGDPIPDAHLTMSETPASFCAFRVVSSELAGTAFTGRVELSCPGSDPQELIGTIARELSLAIADVNGAAATDVRTMAVIDAAPALTWSAGGTPGIEAVPHTVVPCPGSAGLCFAVDAPIPYAVSDLENDPLALRLTATGLPSVGGTFTPNVPGGRLSLFVPVANPAALRGADGRSPVSFTLAASDPWNAGNPVTASFGLVIGNRAPAISPLANAQALHLYLPFDNAYYGLFNIGKVSDPDLDPLVLSAVSSDGVCDAIDVADDGTATVACRVPYDLGSDTPPPLQQLLTLHSVTAKAKDPWGAEVATPPVSVVFPNGSPSIGNQSATIPVETTCVCNPSRCEWTPQGVAAGVFDTQASDPDGDPLWLTFYYTDQPIPTRTSGQSCMPPNCAFHVDNMMGAHFTLQVSDGQLDVTRSYTMVPQCSNDTSAQCGPLPGRACP